jgi:hypothetical protein
LDIIYERSPTENLDQTHLILGTLNCGGSSSQCGDDNDVLLLFGTPEALKFYSKAYSKRAY